MGNQDIGKLVTMEMYFTFYNVIVRVAYHLVCQMMNWNRFVAQLRRLYSVSANLNNEYICLSHLFIGELQ